MVKKSDTFGSFIRAARIQAGLGLRQAAREIGISAAHLSRVENDLMAPSGKLMDNMARLYKVATEEFTRRGSKPRASAAAHGHAIQASPELRALYRLGTTLEAADIEELIRNMLRERGVDESDIEKQLASLKSELPRVAKSVRDGLFAAEAKPRFLTKQKIANMAYEKLLASGFSEQSYQPPTPIELLVDNEADILYRIEKLKADKRGNPLVLGLTGWDEAGHRQIVINTLLADSARDSDGHRFNFTLAHELFHAVEHLPRVPRDAAAPLARIQISDAVFVDRDSSKPRSPAEKAVNSWAKNSAGPRDLVTDEDWREWQANAFASALLMPHWAVTAEFHARFGDEEIVVGVPRNPRDAALDFAGEKFTAGKFSRQSLAELFGVSRQSMAIRLLELGMVKEAKG
jgi:Zn-dependent peptidase ImmA (M78 family)